MSRFIRSALFPILIVIIVAMFIEWVISGNRADETPKAIYSAPFVTTQTVLTNDLQNGLVKNVILDPTSGAAKIDPDRRAAVLRRRGHGHAGAQGADRL